MNLPLHYRLHDNSCSGQSLTGLDRDFDAAPDCKEGESCEGVCGGQPVRRSCFCDELCHENGDCCCDYSKYCPDPQEDLITFFDHKNDHSSSVNDTTPKNDSVANDDTTDDVTKNVASEVPAVEKEVISERCITIGIDV